MSAWAEYFTTGVPTRLFLRHDAYGNAEYSPPQATKCRVEYRRRSVIDASGETVTSEITLFSASPIVAGSLVTVDGGEWRVISCAPMAGLDGAVDHYVSRC